MFHATPARFHWTTATTVGMAEKFRVFVTPTFERQARKAIRNKRELVGVLEETIAVLQVDPHNLTGKHKIRKLSGLSLVTVNGGSGLATIGRATTLWAAR